MNLFILIPTYDERENISTLLREIAMISNQYIGINWSVFVIDDNSPDGTAAEVTLLKDELIARNFSICLIKRERKEGLGKAYIDAFKKILGVSYSPDYVLQMDADGSHNPKFIHEFIDSINLGADLIIGSRYSEGGKTPEPYSLRNLLSRFGNVYTRLLLGRKINDYTGGFNLFSRRVLNSIDFDAINCAGYGFLIALKFKAAIHAKKIIEVPIIFELRENGHSKLPKTTIFKNFILVISIKFKHLLS